LVLAIPRGGVEVGFHVALGLDAPLAMLVARKLPLPGNPETGFGAVAEDGSMFLIEHIAARLGRPLVDQIIRRQRQEIERRIQTLRGGEPLPPLGGRTVIVLDDGIAMGSTIRAAIAMCRTQKAKRIIAAAPVASPSTADELAEIADEIVILETPLYFRAVAQVYENWYDVSDEEVIQIMEEYRRIKAQTDHS
jgi:putative phosphoribosyl transferase